MTREEAIKQLSIRYLGEFDKDREAKDMAVSALTEELSEDGTLTVHVSDGSKVKRVFVKGDNIFGGLYYPDSAGNKGDTVSRVVYEQIKWERDLAIQQLKDLGYFLGEKSKDNKVEWIPFSEELPPKGKKVHVSTFGIVTIGERTSEANEALRLSIFDPMNNTYKNVDPYSYHITRWQPFPDPIKEEN
ncbi:MAG: hypothetical protein IJ819_00250 [Clostridiales bacterium]|nr:hypothetical protein [Clostridiales bacterium]